MSHTFNRVGFWSLGLAAAGFAAYAMNAAAQETPSQESSSWTSSASLQSWAYAALQQPVAKSIVNPGNRVAKLARTRTVSDTRFDYSLKSASTDWIVKPRLIAAREDGDAGEHSSAKAYFNQAFGRFRLSDSVTASLGRELFSWGPANFRSPSNPYYYDAGKTRPLEEVSGIDLVRLDWSGANWSSSIGYIYGGREQDDAWRRSAMWKLDYRGDNFVIGAVVNKPAFRDAFFGGYAQANLGDAWLIYAEAASPTERALVGALGASYSFEGGHSLSVEFLHDERGFSSQEEKAFFRTIAPFPARTSPLHTPPLASAMPKTAPSQLFGQDYLYFLLQNNLQDQTTYWRLSWAENLQDRSRQFGGYIERNLHPMASFFASALLNSGSRKSEFGSVLGSSFTIGFKIFFL